MVGKVSIEELDLTSHLRTERLSSVQMTIISQKESANEESMQCLLADDDISSLPHSTFRFLLTLVDGSDNDAAFSGIKFSARKAMHRLLEDSNVLDGKSTLLRFL